MSDIDAGTGQPEGATTQAGGAPLRGQAVPIGPDGFDDATRNQIGAADPRRSTWLTANAGSGKTRVLTDRVARLLLAGTRPERILCLTYTRAAATEMQNRLLERPGRWAMLPDEALLAELAQMGVGAAAPEGRGRCPRTPGVFGQGRSPAAAAAGGTIDLPAARRLFAAAIETPGGLKVQTIHAFCASVLRRFPLEAGVPVGFSELDDRSAARLRAEVLERMAEAREPEIDDLVTLHGGHELDGFLAAVTASKARLARKPDPAALWGMAGLDWPFQPDRLLAEVMTPDDAAMLAEMLPLLAGGGKTDEALRAALSGVDWDQPDIAALGVLEGALLLKDGRPRIGKLPNKPLREGACAHLMEGFDALIGRVAEARMRRLADAYCQKTLALHRFAHRFATLYETEKRAHGWLDFDDLISRTARMLGSASMAQWVLFRLDGGIDHILVDEAQDTSPEQWQVIERLTAEFTAGEGAREAQSDASDGGLDGGRTLFVVGDPKQSIYSFQGADVAVFADRHEGFARAFAAVGRPMQDAALQHSFRSSPVILDLVDRVFQGEAATGLGGAPRHRAFNTGQPGRVDLWPAIAPPEPAEPLPWDDPAPQDEATSATLRMAEALDAQITALLGQPFTDRKGVTRPIGPGDILILVRRRGAEFDAIIRRLKASGQPVAGADRLKLTAELAVMDLRAVLAFLATPEDDLSLAAALRSPLFDVDEVGLWRLAAGRPRGKPLWAALRDAAAQPDAPQGVVAAQALLSDMIGVSGHLRPHDLLARLLTRHRGRPRLLARLGDEAAEGIDELLGQALTYETTGVPTLTGFLVWLGEDEVEVRRTPSTEGGGAIRIMTVHGAKGLESPVVILPDTQKRNQPDKDPILPVPGGPAVLRGRQGQRPEEVEALIAAQAQAQQEERRRLLYVAMTRAESWLIVAAAGETGTGTDSWHAMITAGFDAAVADGWTEELLPEAVEGAGPVRRLSFGDWPEAVRDAAAPADSGVPGAGQSETWPAGDGPDRERHAAAPAGTMSPADVSPEPAAGAGLAEASATGAAPSTAPAADVVPDWLRTAPPPLAAAPRPRAATALGGAKIIPGDADPRDREAALLAGTRLHLLLEHLPGLDPADRAERARTVLSGAEGGLPTEAELAALLEEATALIDAPDLSAVFTPRAGETVLREVPLAATLPGLGLLPGAVDRLIVGPQRILAIDYKSNRAVPDTADAVPEGILRQMAAYRDALRLIWPGRVVETAILWTRPGRLMPLPDAALDRAMAGAIRAAQGPVAP